LLASVVATSVYAAASAQQTVTVGLAAQTITFNAIPAQTFGTTLALSAKASSGLPVTYTLVQNGDCALSNGALTFVNTPLCGVVATQLGNSVYAAAAPVGQTIAVNVAPQTIVFNPIAPQAVFTKLTLTATASSGLPVSFAVVANGSCSISGNVVTLLNVGTCGVTANQAGSSNYSSAAAVGQTILVTPAAQTVIFNALANKIQGATGVVNATASSGLPVNFTSLTPGVCAVSGAIVSTPSPGTCTIQAAQAGGGNYAAAPSVTQSFTVTPAFTLTISPQGQTVLPGLSLLTNVQIQSATGYTGFVSLNCSGGPAGSGCIGAPLPVLILNGSGLGVVNILVPLGTSNGEYTEALTLTQGSLTDTGTVNFKVQSLF